MARLYSVKGWAKHYEKAQTRKVENAQWVPLPVKHDGKGYRRLMAMEDGLTVYGAWVLILQVAAKCNVRGVLEDEDGPLTAEDLWLKTGCPKHHFERALEVLTSERIAWMLVSDWESPAKVLSYRTGQDRTEQDKTGHAPDDFKVPFLIPLPRALDTPEFGTAWQHWLRYTVNRTSGRASQDTLTRQLSKLATYGPEKAASLLDEAITQGWGAPVWPESKHGVSKQPQPIPQL